MAVHALVPQCAQPFPTICTMVFLLVKLIEKPAPPKKILLDTTLSSLGKNTFILLLKCVFCA